MCLNHATLTIEEAFREGNIAPDFLPPVIIKFRSNGRVKFVLSEREDCYHTVTLHGCSCDQFISDVYPCPHQKRAWIGDIRKLAEQEKEPLRREQDEEESLKANGPEKYLKIQEESRLEKEQEKRFKREQEVRLKNKREEFLEREEESRLKREHAVEQNDLIRRDKLYDKGMHSSFNDPPYKDVREKRKEVREKRTFKKITNTKAESDSNININEHLRLQEENRLEREREERLEKEREVLLKGKRAIFFDNRSTEDSVSNKIRDH